MGEFDDIVERNKRSAEKPPSKKKNDVEIPDVNLIDLISDDESLGGLSAKINPELRSKVLVPLANVLDKYGMSEKIASSDTTQSTVGLLTLLNDIAPVIKGLSDYVSGQKNALTSEDQLFLEQIRDAQDSGDFSELFGGEDLSDIGDTSEEELPPNYHPLLGELPEIDISGKIDWMDIVDPSGAGERKTNTMAEDIMEMAQSAKENPPNLDFFNNDEKFLNAGMVSLDDLASEAGLDINKVEAADTQLRKEPRQTQEDSNMTELLKAQDEVIDLFGDDLIDDIMEETSFDPFDLVIDEEPNELEGGEGEGVVYLTDEEVEEMRSQGFELESIEEEVPLPTLFETEEVIEFNYESLTVPELKDMLRERNLIVAGRKAELIDRLVEWEDSSSNER